MYNKFHDGCPNCKDLRGKHAFNSCCCSIKEQKFRLISDYEDVEDKTQNGNQEQVKIPPVIF